MPWTLSHPAIVLPLRRFSPQPLDFAALVIGSMTPDIGYYIDRFDLSTFAHTLPGSFLACLPTGVILLFFYYLFCRPVCYALPSPHRQALLPLCPDFLVELTSPSDRLPTVEEKMSEWMENGCQLGWLLHPGPNAVYIYRPGSEVEILSQATHITGEGPVAGFTLDLTAIWNPDWD